jgi:hypothetical protein
LLADRSQTCVGVVGDVTDADAEVAAVGEEFFGAVEQPFLKALTGRQPRGA